MKSLQSLCVLSFTLLLGTNAFANGEIVFLDGHVSLVNAKGGIRVPARGERVKPGDTLISGRDSEIHVRMDDTGLLALHPNSRLKIETYSARGLASDQVELRLYAGSVRSVVGWIGRDHPENYVVHAPGADITVRGGCDHEPRVVAEGAGAGVFDRVRCGESVLETRFGSVTVPAGNVGFAPVRDEAGPELLPAIPAYPDGTRHESRVETEKVELERQREETLKLARAESARLGRDRGGKPRMADFNDARLARLALEEMLRAYEQGDIEWIRNRLDPSLIGYQKFLDDMATDTRLCKQMRFHLTDTQVQVSPDLAIVQTRWEKRCTLMPDFKPLLITGNTSFLLHRNDNVWALAQTGTGNATPSCSLSGGSVVCNSAGSPFTSSTESISRTYANTRAGGASGFSGIGGSLGILVANGPALTSCPAITAAVAATPLAANVVVTDTDKAGAASINVVLGNAQGERETLTLTPAVPGGSQFVLASGLLTVRNQVPIQNNGVIEQQPGAACIPWGLTYSDALTPTGPQDVFVVVGP